MARETRTEKRERVKRFCQTKDAHSMSLRALSRRLQIAFETARRYRDGVIPNRVQKMERIRRLVRLLNKELHSGKPSLLALRAIAEQLGELVL